jgi:dynein heavy chain 2
LEEQREALKASVSTEIKTLFENINAFISRWTALKPGAENKDWGKEALSLIYASLDEWTEKLNQLTTTATSVKESCESFGLSSPSLKSLDEISIDVSETSAMWSVFKTYQIEREKIASEDWVTFRTRLFDLQDFSNKWIESTRGKTKGDIVRTRIFDECDGIKRGFNSLKFARGEPFKEEHWSALFKTLSMPRGVKLETLTVGHFIDTIEAVASNLHWLKDLTS